jgi:hypothetical protein
MSPEYCNFSHAYVFFFHRCKHAFHKSCIHPWLTERQGCCPLCKTNVLPDEVTINLNNSIIEEGGDEEEARSTTRGIDSNAATTITTEPAAPTASRISR